VFTFTKVLPTLQQQQQPAYFFRFIIELIVGRKKDDWKLRAFTVKAHFLTLTVIFEFSSLSFMFLTPSNRKLSNLISNLKKYVKTINWTKCFFNRKKEVVKQTFHLSPPLSCCRWHLMNIQ
jgi:hypothetical protein